MGGIPAPEQTPLEKLDEWIRAYEKDLLRICCLYLRDWSMAEDAVQETFLKAYKQMDTFRGDSHEKTWLTRIALNQCRDMRRSAWYRFVDPRVSIDRLPAVSPPPSAEHLALTTAIAKLRPKDMEVVLLYYYEGYRMKEIAQMLHITEAAVSIRIRKAKEKLKDELEGGKDHDE